MSIIWVLGTYAWPSPPIPLLIHKARCHVAGSNVATKQWMTNVIIHWVQPNGKLSHEDTATKQNITTTRWQYITATTIHPPSTTTLHPPSYTMKTWHPHTLKSSTSMAPPSAAQKTIWRAQTITQRQFNATRTVMTHNVITIHTSLCASSGKPAQWSSLFHCLIMNPGGHIADSDVATPFFSGLYSSLHRHQHHHPPHNTPSHICITYFTFNITDWVLYM